MPGQPLTLKVSFSTLLHTTQIRGFRELLDTTRANICNDTPLGRLYNELLVHFAHMQYIELDPGKVRGEVALPGSWQKNMVGQILNCGYSSRYRDKNTPLDIANYVVESSPASSTLVAVQDFDGCSIVLGTLRVAWDDLEIFRLFETSKHSNWPHQATSQRFGEAGRLCMHPLLDLLSSSSSPELRDYGKTYKEVAYTKAMEPAMTLLKEKQIDFFYYVAPPKVQRFLERAGPPFTRVEGVVPRMSSSVQALHEELNLYFKPSDPPENQPQVYYSPVLVPSAWDR
jgi:hypothetical protein